ncbi:MAG TPA: RNA methyltransferase [Steroidobacteraceae bacterium]|nr:RNA methyltransferase [Steroidobacteraceae bacterium]
MSGSIRIVLVATSHPGNIGAAARALKNMGLDELVLVRPREFPHPEASARASGAEDVLARTRVVPDLASAVRDCGLVLASTARERDQNFRVLDARTAAQRLVEAATQQAVAVVFGAERSGLTNEELNSAHALLRVPANPAYAALNLAMAVQIVCYEILCARRDSPPPAATRTDPLATAQDMERLYAHLATVLEQIDFRDRTQRGTHLMNRLRRLLQRAELDANEVNILRGILTAVQQQRRRAGERA